MRIAHSFTSEMVNTGAVNEFTLDDGKPVKTFPAASRPRVTNGCVSERKTAAIA
jgi:hypothetical protein